MKFKVVTLLLVALLMLPAVAAPPSRRATTKSTSALDNDKYINANKILMYINNSANFAYDASQNFGKYDGLYYPFSTVEDILNGANDKTVIYDAGMWMGAIDSATGDTLIAVAEYSTEYEPGNMVAGGPNPSPNDPAFRVYKLYSDSMRDSSLVCPTCRKNDDYLNWPVSQGAPTRPDTTINILVDTLPGPVYDTTVDTLIAIIPALTGDQMAWTVYNDANPINHSNDAGATAPLGVEIQQSAFAFKRDDALGNVVFLKFKVLNKGGKTLQNYYLSLWSDPDLGGASDDLVGSDTMLSLGYCYNATKTDNVYGSTPPAVGFDFFQGPLEFTGNSSDVGKMWGQTYPGYRNLPMSSFNKYINGTDPSSKTHTYNYMQGLERAGTPYVYNGDTLTFFNSGDPVANVGDLDEDPADRRLMLSTGPITFRPNDSVEILAAIVVGQGTNRKSSIAVMKYYDDFAQKAYDDDFKVAQPPVAPVVWAEGLDRMVTLSWTNASEVDHGDYPFEGYTVYQSNAPTGPEWTVVENYAVLNATIKDDVIDPNSGQTEFRVVKIAKDNPIKRVIGITEDFITGGPLRNATTYYYKVGAYSFDNDRKPRILESSTIVAVTPRKPIADEVHLVGFDDTLAVTHTAGVSDGVVLPMVVDPNLLNGHTYSVTFRADSTLGIVWNLLDVTAGDTILKNQTNFSGDDVYHNTDGFRVKVSQNTDPFKNFEVVANGAGPLDPPEGGAADFQGFPSLQPTDAQQVGDGRWLFHTADNGSRGSYTAFKSRTTRDGGNAPEIGIYDYEMRFTYDTGNWAYPEFGGVAGPVPVPFELWNIGIATPGNPSDDFKMVPWILENDDDSTYNLSAYGAGVEHTVSGGDNDPWTDWIYWAHPSDHTPGDAGYLASKAEMLAGTYDGSRESEVFARTVLVNWNGGVAPPFTQDLPEQGTIFRITTSKPIAVSDVYTFVATAPVPVAKTDAALQNIKAVPNPYYLFSSYDRSVLARRMQFTNLPAKCTISIFTLSGDRIAVISKDDPSTSLADWDLLTDNRVPLASGIYIYVVDAPGFGQKIGKMAIFTEQEQLNTY